MDLSDWGGPRQERPGGVLVGPHVRGLGGDGVRRGRVPPQGGLGLLLPRRQHHRLLGRNAFY